MRGSGPIAWMLVAAAIAACASPADESVTTRTVTTTSSVGDRGGAAVLRRVRLLPGARITIGTDAEGRTSIAVVVPDGLPDPGTYTSRSTALASDLAAIGDSLGEWGSAAWMEVTERNEIVYVAHEVLLQSRTQ